ncbi:hypothetical protein G5B37_12640 [Rasiella rasia]|uniref:Uncharacterized protein n=1 Tax=Rasiella rasia TaxID=2744027 RepID=A0A6G6GP98_9FLAO|nr:hypothetical protein [Rasiella rasia]QIE60379.1 hypothetical protein G5B37_12640 [Rasiella rasia]
MEPNKFEEHIRTQLEEREIQPSENAWATLEAQLGDKKESNKTLWYAIAASLVAVLVVGSFLLKDDTNVSSEIVQETPQIEVDNSIELTISEEKEGATNDDTVNTTEIVSTNEKALPKKTYNTTQIATSKKPMQKVQTKEPAVAIASVQKDKTPSPLNQPIKRDFVDTKVDEVVAQVQLLNAGTATVTAEAIEILLQNAQKEIATQRILNQATTRVDPASLLNDVETELERGFRDKVFDALGEGFNKVRTAVVERNN